MKDLLQSIDEELVPILEKAKALSERFGMELYEAVNLIKWYAKKDSVKESIDAARDLVLELLLELEKQER